jgi:hypothetical protein
MWEFNKLTTLWDSDGIFILYRILVVLCLFSCGIVKVEIKFFT